MRDLEQIFLSPVFCNYGLNFLATKLCVHKIAVHKYSVQGKRTHKQCSKQVFISIILLIIVALILRVVSNSFQTFHLVNLDGSMWSKKYRMTVIAKPKNHSLSFTTWLPTKLQPEITSFSASKFLDTRELNQLLQQLNEQGSKNKN